MDVKWEKDGTAAVCFCCIQPPPIRRFFLIEKKEGKERSPQAARTALNLHSTPNLKGFLPLLLVRPRPSRPDQLGKRKIRTLAVHC